MQTTLEFVQMKSWVINGPAPWGSIFVCPCLILYIWYDVVGQSSVNILSGPYLGYCVIQDYQTLHACVYHN